MREALWDLVSAVAALGFERARDAITQWGDEPDQDASDWHNAFVDALCYAVRVAECAADDGNPREPKFLSFAPRPGGAVTWQWQGEADADFAGIVLRSVEMLLGKGTP